MRQNIFTTALLMSVSATTVAHAALRTVALTGQQAPGAPAGVIFERFGAELGHDAFAHGVALNDAGQTAFRANLAGDGIDFTNNQGVWSEGSGSLALVARTGNQAPGAPSGVNFSTDPALELFSPVLNSVGQTAFYGATTDGGLGLWSGGSGSLVPVARSGQQAPGTPAGINFAFDNLYEYLELPILNDAGQSSFRSYLNGVGVTSANNFGLWSEGSDGLALRARKGNQAPGLPVGVNFGIMAPAGLNDAGQIVFAAQLSGAGVNNNNDKSIWSDVSDSLALVARKGSQAPGMPVGVTFNDLVDTGAINNAGQFAFVPGLSNQGSTFTQDGIWLYNSTNMSPLLLRGEHPPGTPAGVTYDVFGFSPALNEAGQVLTGALLSGSGVDESNQLAVFLSDSAGHEKLIFRTGDQAPGTPPGVVFHATFDSFAEGVLNDNGQVAFGQSLAGAGVNATNDFGLWATDSTGTLQLIAREGDQLEVAPGDFRKISGLNRTDHTANSNGWPSAFNNLGQLAFWASFTDGSQGLFVSDEVAFVPGDYNGDNVVDAADYTVWRDNVGGGALVNRGVGVSGPVGAADYDVWKSNFGLTLGKSGAANAAVPEATTCLLYILALGYCPSRWRRRSDFSGRSAIRCARLLNSVSPG